METKKIENTLKIIYSKAFCEDRMKVTEKDGTVRVVIDVHKMKAKEANLTVKNIINLVKGQFILVVCHGYNGGTAIRDLLQNSFTHPRINKQFISNTNPGNTNFFVSAAI